MNIFLIISFFIIVHLRKRLQTATNLPEWDRKLIAVMAVCIGLQIVEFSNSHAKEITKWLSYIILIVIIGNIYFNELFKSVRSSLFAVLPLILVSLLGDLLRLVAKSFYDEWGNVFEITKGFAIIWMITILILNKRQRKALEKERIKTHEEERQNKIMAGLKSELEVQVAERTAALTQQKQELEIAMAELKSAQSQLIQAEKLASLGELTAGIAHEIQNPLNFVNNFSEVNTELIEEMKTELENGNHQLALEIANDIKDNAEKILHHGKRADGIVKGMLQHSRISNGVKEPTDLNALADEYLRLAYHGLRAKDKSFNATMKTNFDERIKNINIIPQDIGRVILNLITNAFYAVTEKKKITGAGYEPTVTVSTAINPLSFGGGVKVIVKDNGDGIPQKVLEKIFQPFFTTKPTGHGTGLGLSLSYDIIKAHNGELTVSTKEGEGTEFVILLPAITKA
jgi:signal transduction histidine kinase